jgi:hypothetical protein
MFDQTVGQMMSCNGGLTVDEKVESVQKQREGCNINEDASSIELSEA